MRAAVALDGKLVMSREHAKPVPQEGEVLVRVTRAGICDTDLQILQGYMGFRGVLGHEFVGVAQSGKFAGRRITSEINCSCARCEMCQGGLSNHCPNRTVLGILGHDGAFADYLAVPERNLHVVPNEIGVDEAVFIEPLAAAFQIPRQVQVDKRSKVLVLGDGKLGILVAQVLKAQGCQVLVAGKYPEKLRIVERLGAATELIGQLRRVRAYNVVVDCTGSPTGLPAALEFVRPRGTIVLKTTVATGTELHLAPIVIDEITLVGSRCGPFATAIEALRTKRIEVASLVQDIYRLTDAAQAIEAAAQPGATKILLAVDEAVPSIKRLKG
ncbi:MAG: alcohol dehydrogenase catalytic domain-containing protein [Planctomycetes bacterium]|nr:alcohol dehydrogenase catalytic domain-containing protein [Planctomycetota bacterium]